jgi:hypothetical protein
MGAIMGKGPSVHTKWLNRIQNGESALCPPGIESVLAVLFSALLIIGLRQ